MDICTVNFTTENEGIQREKAVLNSAFDKRPDLHTQLHQINEQLVEQLGELSVLCEQYFHLKQEKFS